MRTSASFLFAAVAALAITTAAFAGSKTYQVTGPILALTPDTITVQKGTETWEVGRSAATKVTGDLAVGSKVTISYTMDAVTADVKPAADKGADGTKKDGKKKAK